VGIAGSIGSTLAKRVGPSITGGTVRQILERAIDGIGPVPGAAESAEHALADAHGDTDKAIDSVIGAHIRLAGAQGFLTNLGGLVTMAVTAPANLAAVAVLQCHLAATILYIRDYDLTDPNVRDAALVCLLDDDSRRALAKDAKTDVSPQSLVKGLHGPEVRNLISRAVVGDLIAGIGGKRLAAFAAKRIPVLGGAVGAAGDALATRRVGRETARMPRSGKPRPIVVDALKS
jgi:hypothetical protein